MRAKASISLFLALLLTCVFSGIFALLEAARVSGLRANAQMCTVQAGDGLLASYNRPLWKNYHLLFWEGEEGDFPQLSQVGLLQQEIVEGNWEQSAGFYQNFYVLPIHLSNVKVQSYQLATDDGGAVFQKQAAEVMKRNVAVETVASLVDWISQTDYEGDAVKAAGQEQAAMDILENLQNAANGEPQNLPEVSEDIGQSAPQAPGQAISENPMEWMKKVKQNGFLAILMPEEDISVKEMDVSDSVGRRNLQEGTMAEEKNMTALDQMFFRLYLSSVFSDVTDTVQDRTLDYEMEYLIAGKRSDKENLSAVVNRLLLLREAANMMYLETNPQKQQEALAVAAVLAAAVAQPELAEPVKHAVMAAWAYAESISDVRILLAGGKVSLVKTEEQWHTQLGNLASSVMEYDGKQQTRGLSYDGYLQVLLWTTSDKKLAERAMTLMEKNTGVCMDRMISRMNCNYEYTASVLFWDFVGLGNNSFSEYQFTEESVLDYLGNK